MSRPQLLHTVFLGFVFAMIFGHAPIIFPVVLGLPVPFRPAFYAHVAALHLSLALRVVGDLGGWTLWRQWGGLFNVLAVLLFFVNTVRSVLQGSLSPASSRTAEGKERARVGQAGSEFAALEGKQ